MRFELRCWRAVPAAFVALAGCVGCVEVPPAGDPHWFQSGSADVGSTTDASADVGSTTDASADVGSTTDANVDVGADAVCGDGTCEGGETESSCAVDCSGGGGSGTAGMVLIPAGDFWMGCNAAKDDFCGSDEVPQHQVTLSAYYMDLDEVTVDDYAGCVSAGSCSTPDTGAPCNWGENGKGSHPINCVDWSQASAYCAWADKRLPTEAEWEKAARGGCETVTGDCKTGMRTYPWGEAAASCTYAVMYDGGNGCGTGGTLPVGSKSPAGDGPYGLRDMSGNVWEWCADWYDEGYYESSPSTNPKGPAGGEYRVVRGGSWFGGGNVLRAANRGGNSPEDRDGGLGFRCARTP